MNWWRRTRAAAVMGLTWAFAWSGAGAILARIPGMDSDLPFPILFAPLGFLTGMIFSGILVAIAGRRGIERVSVPKFAGWGALSGLVLSAIFVVGAALRGASPWGEFLVFGPALATAGAACAAGSLALARRAGSGELRSGNPDRAELPREGPRT